MCHGIYEDSQNQKYVIIGNLEKPEEFGLEKKVGEGEVLISVPRNLIDDMERENEGIQHKKFNANRIKMPPF